MASDWGVARNRRSEVAGWWVIQALMRAVVSEMAHIPVENNSGVSLVVDQQSVGVLRADAAHEPFRVAVRLGRARRDLDHGDGFGGEHGIKGGGEFAVPVADHQAEGADAVTEVHQQVASGLSGPGRCGMGGDAQEMDPAGVDFHHQQNVKAAQRDGVEGEKVSGQQASGLSAQEGPPPGVGPAGCRAEPRGGQAPPNRGGIDAMPETDEFAADSAVAPGRILSCQTQHQSLDVVGDRWAA